MLRPNNDTLRFLVPVLYTKEYTNDFFVNKYFEGAYTSDINYPEFDDKLLLVYNYQAEEDFVSFEEKIMEHPLYAGKYEYDIFDTIVYIFNIPEKFDEDYIRLLANVYDQFSSEFKLAVIKFWEADVHDEIFQIVVGELEYAGEPFEKQIFNIEDDDSDDLHDQIRRALEAESQEEGLGILA